MLLPYRPAEEVVIGFNVPSSEAAFAVFNASFSIESKLFNSTAVERGQQLRLKIDDGTLKTPMNVPCLHGSTNHFSSWS